MKKTVISVIAIPLVVLMLAAGGLALGESRAHAALQDRVTSYAEKRFPQEQVRGLNVRGRPYLLSQQHGEVPLAYVDLAAPPHAVGQQVILHNLEKGSVGKISRIVTLPYPSAGTSPQRAADGSYTETALVDGAPVRYSATFADGVVQVAAAGGRAPAPLRLSAPVGFAVAGVWAADEGIAVELVSRG